MRPPARPAPALSLPTKLAFGMGDLGSAVMTAIMGFYLNAFLIETAGLRPAAAAAILFAARLWDCVNDPLVGALSDRTRTRWGRRRPWLLFGALPFGAGFALLWQVPDLDEGGRFAYYLAVALFLDVAQSVVAIPYTALTPELAPRYDERTALNVYRFGFAVTGGSLAVFVHSLLLRGREGPALLAAYAWSGALWGAVIALSALVAFAGTREPPLASRRGSGAGESGAAGRAGPGEASLSPGRALRTLLGNRAFLLVTALYLLSWLTLQFVQNNLVLYLRYWVRAEAHFPWLLLLMQAVTVLSLPVWAWASGRIGKQRAYMLGAGLLAAVAVTLFFVPPGGVRWLYALAPAAALGLGVCYLMPWSMLPDAVDLDELETGRRREGLFYGIFVFLQKIGLSLGIGLANLTLEWAGYVNPEIPGVAGDQPAAVLLALRIFVSGVPAALLLASLFVARAYPLTRERHEAIRAALAARRG